MSVAAAWASLRNARSRTRTAETHLRCGLILLRRTRIREHPFAEPLGEEIDDQFGGTQRGHRGGQCQRGHHRPPVDRGVV